MAISAACINKGSIIPSVLSNYSGKELILLASVPECALLGVDKLACRPVAKKRHANEKGHSSEWPFS